MIARLGCNIETVKLVQIPAPDSSLQNTLIEIQGDWVQIPVGLSLFLPHPITFGFMPTPGTYRLTPAERKSLGLIFKSEDHLWGDM